MKERSTNGSGKKSVPPCRLMGGDVVLFAVDEDGTVKSG